MEKGRRSIAPLCLPFVPLSQCSMESKKSGRRGSTKKARGSASNQRGGIKPGSSFKIMPGAGSSSSANVSRNPPHPSSSSSARRLSASDSSQDDAGPHLDIDLPPQLPALPDVPPEEEVEEEKPWQPKSRAEVLREILKWKSMAARYSEVITSKSN